MDRAEKVREGRLRRAAARQGLVLSRSRTRDLRALTFGRYWLFAADSDVAVFGSKNGRPNATLDEIEAYLNLPHGER
jgi:hypothetical protein